MVRRHNTELLMKLPASENKRSCCRQRVVEKRSCMISFTARRPSVWKWAFPRPPGDLGDIIMMTRSTAELSDDAWA